jgi:DNA-directed RNA polymerase sigma subunit (sigma70/sigma32)
MTSRSLARSTSPNVAAITLEEVGLVTNLTRERIRQVETRGLLKLLAAPELKEAA